MVKIIDFQKYKKKREEELFYEELDKWIGDYWPGMEVVYDPRLWEDDE